MFNPILRLTERQRTALGKLLDSRVVDQVLDADDQDNVTHRRALLAQRATLQREAAGELPAAEAQVREAVDQVARATAALREAQAIEAEARQRHHLAKRAKPIDKIERELIASTDPRVRDYRFYLQALDGQVCISLQTWPAGDDFGRVTVQTNAEAIAAVRDVLRGSIASTHALELQAVSYGELTQELVELGERLAPALARLRLNPPQIANDGEIGPPQLWRDRSSWLVDEIEVPAKREAPAAKARR